MTEQRSPARPVALITGGSRGVGAATARTLASVGYDVAITYRNKAARAAKVASAIEMAGARALTLASDITDATDRSRLVATLRDWAGRLDALILNASGGMERDLVAAHPDYPLRINRDAQLAMLDAALPLMGAGGVVVFVTSHWAHLYGRIAQIPAYEPVAESKRAGEVALRERMAELAARGLRLIIVTGDLIEGTITPKLLERTAPGLKAGRSEAGRPLPTAEEMGRAIALAAQDATLPSGHIIVIGEPLESLLA